MALLSDSDVSEVSGKAQPGQILLVIHDFEARSPDELSLVKGDRIELVEPDDEFGDGWFLGRRLNSTDQGLFPQVYTTSDPKSPSNARLPSYSLALENTGVMAVAEWVSVDTNPKAAIEPALEPSSPPAAEVSSQNTSSEEQNTSESMTYTPHVSSPTMISPTSTHSSSILSPTTPLNPTLSAIKNHHVHGQESPVMNETLTVIEEHITDMNTPRQSLLAVERRLNNDSGSEYSSHLDHRISYITGHDTDEEEQNTPSEKEVLAWTPSQVADHLRDIGVEPRHCEIFQEQEISGEVLLGMDQASLFIKEFDLGPVGRRLRTWHKIKALQQDIRSCLKDDRRTPRGDDDESAIRTNAGSIGTVLPRIPSLMERPSTRQQVRRSNQPALSPQPGLAPPSPPFSPTAGQSSPVRPSAASVRDYNHSRRHSSIDGPISPTTKVAAPHKKQSSFDRSWSMGLTSATLNRPSSSGARRNNGGSLHYSSKSADRNALALEGDGGDSSVHSPQDLDRGYFSGGEADSRKLRNVLKKRDITPHSRNSSYTDEQRQRSATSHFRMSGFGSIDSTRDATSQSIASPTIPAAASARTQKFRLRRSSTNDSHRPALPPKDLLPPTVTKLEYDTTPADAITAPCARESVSLSNGKVSPLHLMKSLRSAKPARSPGVTGLRAISDAVTESEKSLVTPATSLEENNSTPKEDSLLQSPAPTSSSTPSVSKSFELESPEISKSSFSIGGISPSLGTSRRKSKKNTSAYIRGLEHKTPQEQMIGCDYSGWMKKKSTNLMTTWKPRLFILRGRRLSYYYTENDEQEKGLIDISSHRVLAADADRITGLHATLTGATNSPTSPPDCQTPTAAATDAAAQESSSLNKAGGDSTFIFKLVPPRTGLSKAVNFTKPAIHYFAVDNVQQGRLWMAALMKATIDRDDSKPLTTTYQQKTISLAKARAMRHRPPALMGLDENLNEDIVQGPASDDTGLKIKGLDGELDEQDSGIGGMEQNGSGPKKTLSLNAQANIDLGGDLEVGQTEPPDTA
ncbi:MAG: polar growth protein [Trizodia sp. TS-e1964]|nr:MAG: polar growth protein [Trizodia sp. TS-e1964]